jgi:hypothetical protein
MRTNFYSKVSRFLVVMVLLAVIIATTSLIGLPKVSASDCGHYESRTIYDSCGSCSLGLFITGRTQYDQARYCTNCYGTCSSAWVTTREICTGYGCN